MPADTDYSLKEVFDEFRVEVRADLGRIEGKVDMTDEKVARLMVTTAVSGTKIALIVALVGAAGTILGGIFTAMFLQAVAK